jgi:hypothetical protein
MGKLLASEIRRRWEIMDYCNDSLRLALVVENHLGNLAEDERIHIQLSPGALGTPDTPGTPDRVRIYVSGHEDHFVDTLRRAITAGTWQRRFYEKSGYFEFTADTPGISWTIIPEGGARGCTIKPVRETIEVIRYESVCQ